MYDILIKNGTVIDGTGKDGYSADVGILEEKIVDLGDLSEAETKVVIDATGLIVSPGFIDIHTHTDTGLLIEPRAESKIRQGVTTEIGGNCGGSVGPLRGEALSDAQKWMDEHGIVGNRERLGDFLDLLEDRKIGVNYATFVGNGTIRSVVIGAENRPPTAEELSEMKREIAQAMEEGALGLSTGLIYVPSIFADTDEIVELAKVASSYGGYYASHIRGEGATLLTALSEAVEIGRRADIPVQIAHVKASGRNVWGKAGEVLAIIDKARSEGIDVTGDRYPYLAGSTGLKNVLPVWAREGTKEEQLQRLKDNEIKTKIKEYINSHPFNETRWDEILLCIDGATARNWAQRRNVEPAEMVCQLLIENEMDVSMCTFTMCQEDTEVILSHPFIMVASDSSAKAPYGELSEGKPHPRSYGTFPRALQEYSRERQLFGVSEAVRKMTSMPAQKIGLTGRGVLKEGNYADICIFDYENIKDNATYAEPHQYPAGIEYVLVNGQIAVNNGEHTGVLTGKVLRHNA
ncbi:D-aminoacylase [Candidatus Poribacteria bacterium]|nr:D-aminoacylase [Candidatus Poribacteria bacterium]